MKAVDVLKYLNGMGAMVRLDGADLCVRAPQGVLTPERKELLRAWKPALVRLLSTYPCSGCGLFAFPEAATVCYWCKTKHDGTL